MSSSIACPKCGRVSSNLGDIEHRYCATCGYHDAPVDAPLGVPGVSAKWRQTTPVMELRALTSSLEMNFYNWANGIVGNTTFGDRFERIIADIEEIYDHVERTGRSDAW